MKRRKSRPLGHVQRTWLFQLKQTGPATIPPYHIRDTKVLESLERRGLVERTTTWKLSKLGKAVAAGGSR